MTVTPETFDGWTIHPDYRFKPTEDPAPIRRSPKVYDFAPITEIYKRIVENEHSTS